MAVFQHLIGAHATAVRLNAISSLGRARDRGAAAGCSPESAADQWRDLLSPERWWKTRFSEWLKLERVTFDDTQLSGSILISLQAHRDSGMRDAHWQRNYHPMRVQANTGRVFTYMV